MLSVPLAFSWRDVLFANWPVDPEVVDAHLPEPFDAQTYDGDAWLSLVAFVNEDTRPRGLPAAVGVDLPELNLRTYVTCGGEPGVYFLSLDVSSAATVLGARLTHHLPYFYGRVRADRAGDEVRFSSRRRHPGSQPARYEATYRPTGERFTADPGSRAEFLTERRRLFTTARDGTVRHTDVSHEPWPLSEATVAARENTLLRANGFGDPDDGPLCYYSPGVSVVTTRSRRWRSG